MGRSSGPGDDSWRDRTLGAEALGADIRRRHAEGTEALLHRVHERGRSADVEPRRDGHAGSGQRRSSAARGDQLIAERNELTCCFDRAGLIAVLDADEHASAIRQLDTCGELALDERFAERLAHTHHFAGRFHLGTEDRIDAGEFDKRKDRLLHPDMVECRGLEGEARQRLPGHDPGGDLGHRNADHLGDEGHRA